MIGDRAIGIDRERVGEGRGLDDEILVDGQFAPGECDGGAGQRGIECDRVARGSGGDLPAKRAGPGIPGAGHHPGPAHADHGEEGHYPGSLNKDPANHTTQSESPSGPREEDSMAPGRYETDAAWPAMIGKCVLFHVSW